MPRVAALELLELDLPFRRPFRHARAERAHSGSLFLRCVTDGGHCGYGETLPRPYVTGERREDAFELLTERVLPRLLDMEFVSFEALHAFLAGCDGKAPETWVAPDTPQTAAWCAVDLALLDAFARDDGRSLQDGGLPAGPGRAYGPWPERLRYSVVLSSDSGGRTLATLLKARLYGIREAKLKVGAGSPGAVRLARRVLGRRARLRADSNMDWTYEEAREGMARLASDGIESFEQPLAAEDLDGMARLVAGTGLDVMADESLHDRQSLERLIERRACTAVNVRIAKCGGLVASIARSVRALEAGLTVQVGCQVGETSQLSAAQLVLIRTVGDGVRHAEGCFGERLLARDPVRPPLEFRRGGRPPRPPVGFGFGTIVDMETVGRHAGRRVTLGSPLPPTEDLR
jgi:L-Ala-D/L-Glu epimerase